MREPDDSVDPRFLYDKPETFREYVQFQSGQRRRADPERQRLVDQAIDRFANSPREGDEARRLIAQLDRDGPSLVAPEDVPELLQTWRDGGDPRDLLREREQGRMGKYHVQGSPEADQAEMQATFKVRPGWP